MRQFGSGRVKRPTKPYGSGRVKAFGKDECLTSRLGSWPARLKKNTCRFHSANPIVTSPTAGGTCMPQPFGFGLPVKEVQNLPNVLLGAKLRLQEQATQSTRFCGRQLSHFSWGSSTVKGASSFFNNWRLSVSAGCLYVYVLGGKMPIVTHCSVRCLSAPDGVIKISEHRRDILILVPQAL